MGVASVKTYARARLDALGYKEWTDGFNRENVPKTKLDTVYHIELGRTLGTEAHQNNQEMETPFLVRLFRSPNRKPLSLIDQSVAAADLVIYAFIKGSNRVAEVQPKNIRFDSLEFLPLDETNDNGVLTEIGFTALVIISTL